MTPHSSPSLSRALLRPWPSAAPHASSRAKRFTPTIALADRVPYPVELTLIEQTANSSSLAADDSTQDLWSKKVCQCLGYVARLFYLGVNLRSWLPYFRLRFAI